MKKLLALLLALVMVLSMAACAPADTGSSTPNTTDANGETNPPEPKTITLYPLNANLLSGTVDGWLGEYLLSKGIILEIWPYSDEKFTAMVTAGQLPDILYVGGKVALDELSDSNLLLDLEPYADMLPHIFGNEGVVDAINFVKETKTNGVANLVPLRIGKNTDTIDTERAAVKLYWEAYEKIGCPEIKTWDDLIDVLKQMKEVYPKSDLGEETYGARLFANDSSYFYSIYNWFVVNGCTVDELANFIEVNAVDKTFDYILDDDSMYKKGLAFFNKMFREGLVDPESMNKDRTTQQASVTAGGSLAGWAGAPGWEQYGYYPVYIGESVSVRNEQGYPFGTGGYIAISAQTEEIDTCLKLLDLLADPDAVLTMRCGPQGQLWDVDENGKAYITDKGYRYYAHGDIVKINGEDFELFNTQFIINTGVETSYGVPNSVAGSMEMLEFNASSDLMDSWKEVYPGYSGFRELLLDKDQFVNDPFNNLLTNFTVGPTDEQKLIRSAAKDLLVTASWKMIYAETEAEFEKLWDDVVAACEEAGARGIYDWRIGDLAQAMEKRDALFGK